MTCIFFFPFRLEGLEGYFFPGTPRCGERPPYLSVPELCRIIARPKPAEPVEWRELPLCLLGVGDSLSLGFSSKSSSSRHCPNSPRHLPAMQHPKSLALLGAVCSFTVAAAGSVPRGVGPECKFEPALVLSVLCCNY